jgi:integrase
VTRRFCQDFGDRLAAGIDSPEIVRWLAGRLPTEWERMNHRRILSVFFAYCKGIGATTTNPVDDVPKPRLPPPRTEIFSVHEARELLFGALALDPALVPFLAIGLFAGLRSAELERLDWSDITEGAIRIEPRTAKTASRRVVELSANLLEWLLPYRKASGPIIPPGNYWRRLERLSVATGVRWRSNGMRHSFASYHLAAYENSGKTALTLGHSNQNLIFRHYRELVSQKQAREYFGLVPPTREGAEKLVAFG